MIRRTSMLAASLALLSAVVPAARADGMKITQHDFTPDGDPRLVANAQPDATAAVPEWSICTPDCGPTMFSGALLVPGPVPAGTTFQASVTTITGLTTTDRSKLWQGTVTKGTPPSVMGEPKVGATVTATAGTWTGGWGDDVDRLELRFCPTPKGESGCVRIPTIASTVIDSAYAGWYVGALDLRTAAEAAVPTAGYIAQVPGQPSPYGSPGPSQTIAISGLVGPIASLPSKPGPLPPGSGGRITPPASPPPTVKLSQRATRKGRALIAGTVACPAGCAAQIVFARSGVKLAKNVKIAPRGTVSIRVPRRLASARSIQVSVLLNTRLVARERVALR